MANTSYIVRVQESGKQTFRGVIARKGKNFQPQKIVGTENTTYVLTDISDNPVTQILLKQKDNDLQIFLSGKDSDGVPDLVIENYGDVQRSATIVTKTPQGYTEFLPESSWFGHADITSSVGQTLKADDGVSVMSSIFKSPWTLPGLVVAAAGIAAASKNGSSTSTPPGGDTSITSYATDTTGRVAAPDVYAYQAAKITGVNSDNLGLVNSGLQRVKADTTDKINVVVAAAAKIVAKANGSASDNTTNDPVLADYQALKINLIGADANATQLGLFTDIIKNRSAFDVNSVAKIDALASITDKLMSNAKDNTPATQLTVSDLVGIGLTDITTANVAGYLSAIRASANDGSGISSFGALKSISDAYLKIFNLADAARGNADTSKLPTLSDYATAGVVLPDVIKNDPNALKLLNDTLDGLGSALVSKVVPVTAADANVNLTDLATTLGHVMQIHNGGAASALAKTSLTPAALNALLGVSTVTNSNLTAILKALEASNGVTFDAYAKLLAAVNVGVVVNYADSSVADASHVAPTLPQYQDLGLAKADTSTDKAVTSSNYQALNSAVEALGGTDVNTTQKIQSVLNAYSKVLAMADAVRGNAVQTAVLQDYTTLGALKNYDASTGAIDGTATSKAAQSGLQSASALSLLNSAVDGLSTSNVDTIAELNKIAIAVDKVLELAEGTSGIPSSPLTVADLTTLGVTSALDSNKAQIVKNITALNNADGSLVDTLPELQSLVSLAAIQVYATDRTQSINLQNFKDLQFTDVTWDNTLSNAVTTALPTTSDAVTGGPTGTLHTLSLAYQSVIKEAGDTGSLYLDPTQVQYEAILGTLHLFSSPSGGLDKANVLSLMNDVVRHNTTTALDSKSELEALATKVDNLMKTAAGISNTSFSELSALGFDTKGWTDISYSAKINKVNSLIQATDDSGSGIKLWSDIQNILSSQPVLSA